MPILKSLPNTSSETMESLEQTTLSFEGLSINLSGDSSLLKTHSLKIGPEMTSTLAFLKFCVYGLRNNSWSLQNNYYVQNLSMPPACSDHSLNVKIEKACLQDSSRKLHSEPLSSDNWEERGGLVMFLHHTSASNAQLQFAAFAEQQFPGFMRL